MPIKTQHRIKRKKVLKEITEQNYALQRRIDTARPTIDLKKMKKDHEHHKKVLSLMSRFKQNIPIQNRRKLSPMKSKSTKILHNYDRSVNFSADEERNYYTDHPTGNNRYLPPLENKRQTISEEEQERLEQEAEDNLMLEDYESNRIDVDVQVDEEEIEKSLNSPDNKYNNNNQEEEEEGDEENYHNEDDDENALDMMNDEEPIEGENNKDNNEFEDEFEDKENEEENEEETVGEQKSEVITIDDAIVDDLQVAEEVNPQLEDSIVLHATELHEPADNLKPIPGISEEVEYILPSHNKYEDIEINVIQSEYIDINTGEVLYVEDEEAIHNKQIPGISEEIDLILPQYKYDERDINDLYMMKESTEFVINSDGNEEDKPVVKQEEERPQTPSTVPGISEIVELILPYKRYDEVDVVFCDSQRDDGEGNNDNEVYEGKSEEFIVDFPPKQFEYVQPVLCPSELIDINTGEIVQE